MNKIILKIHSGSHLYGTNTENSDEDYLGIYLNTKEELLGFQSSEELTENIISKAENGRNTKNAIDCKYFELRKFCRLALKGNPTILEILFVNKENILEITKEGEELLSLRNEFLSKNIYNSFMGYAFAQKKKAFIKSENLEKIYSVYNYICTHKYNETIDKVSLIASELYNLHLIELDELNDSNKEFPMFICGDLRFNNILIKKLKSILEDRINKASWRKDGILQYGMDYKFMSHNIRLMLEGMELIRTNNITLPLRYRELVKVIKNGKMPNTEIIKLMEKYENEFHTLKENNLPENGNYDLINNFIIKTYFNYLKENEK